MNECKKGNWGGGDFILVAKNMGGIIFTYTKMTRGDFFREGFCPYPKKNIRFLYLVYKKRCSEARGMQLEWIYWKAVSKIALPLSI